MSNFKDKYLKYKEKYSKLKNQIGSAPLSDLPPEPLLDNLDELSQIKLAETDRRYRDAFLNKYSGYNSTFAPDITIINNTFCNNQPGCNKFITHYRIKDILNRNGIPIPNDGVYVTLLLYEILLKTIRTNNKSDAEFLVSIGVTIEDIEDDSFRGQGLDEVYIPSSVTRIGARAFANNNLINVQIPESVTIIDEEAFANNQLVNVDLPNSLISIERYAFYRNMLQNIIIPPNVIRIDDNAFARNFLIDINIPDSVSIIGFEAFRYNGLLTVNIGRNVITIGRAAFYTNPINNVRLQNRFNNALFINNERYNLFNNIPGINFNYYL